MIFPQLSFALFFFNENSFENFLTFQRIFFKLIFIFNQHRTQLLDFLFLFIDDSIEFFLLNLLILLESLDTVDLAHLETPLIIHFVEIVEELFFLSDHLFLLNWSFSVGKILSDLIFLGNDILHIKTVATLIGVILRPRIARFDLIVLAGRIKRVLLRVSKKTFQLTLLVQICFWIFLLS